MSAPKKPPSPHGRLPRGRHGLAPELVHSIQRERLLAAAAAAFAEKGPAALVVADITGRAGISRATFYIHFADKLECVRAVHEAAAAQLMDHIEASCRSMAWPDNLVAATRAAVDFAEQYPAETAVLAIDPTAVEITLGEQVQATRSALVELLRRASPSGDGRASSDLTGPGLVAAASSLIAGALRPMASQSLEQVRAELPEVLLRFCLAGPEMR